MSTPLLFSMPRRWPRWAATRPIQFLLSYSPYILLSVFVSRRQSYYIFQNYTYDFSISHLCIVGCPHILSAILSFLAMFHDEEIPVSVKCVRKKCHFATFSCKYLIRKQLRVADGLLHILHLSPVVFTLFLGFSVPYHQIFSTFLASLATQSVDVF